jgi:hypothetical protein
LPPASLSPDCMEEPYEELKTRMEYP